MKTILIGTLMFLFVTGLQAQNNPVSFSTDSRIKQVEYQENNVVPIRGVAFFTTQIVFGAKEEVLDIEGGDSAAWMVTYHPELANTVFVKPTSLVSNTNLTVITNQHCYYFHLIANKTLAQNQSEQTYALKFSYPSIKPVLTKTNAVKSNKETPPKVVNTAYRFSGSPQLVPRHVFDDGKFTYFELNPNAAVPAIFAVDDKDGKESTVNTRREGKYLIVQRLAPQFTLRQGPNTTSVFNTKEINRIAANRRPQ